jgi:Na+-driven multidrug efflux pump
MPALSMSITNGSNIGKYIGKGDTVMAKRYAKVSQLIMLVDIAV